MSRISLRIISPGYAGFQGAYIDSLLRLRKLCAEREIPFHWSCVEHRADIVAVRNFIGHTFMASDCTHLLMPDSDIGFEAADVMKMLDRQAPFAAAAPPGKALRLDNFAKAIKTELENPERFLAKFYVDPLPEDVAKGHLSIDDEGFCKVAGIGGAFMLLQREVFEAISSRHPELQTRKGCGYFERLIEDGDVYSEDKSFCRRWRQAGGEILLLANASMTHTGPHTFSGNLAQHSRGGLGI